MDNSSIKFWKTFSILLLILNLGLLLFLFIQSQPRHMQGREDQGGPAKFIIEKLALNQSQIEQFNSLKKMHHDSIVQLDKEGKNLRQQYFSGLQTNPCLQSDSILILIMENQKQKELVTFTHFEAVKKLCNPTQELEFNKIIEEILQRLHRNPPPNQRP